MHRKKISDDCCLHRSVKASRPSSNLCLSSAHATSTGFASDLFYKSKTVFCLLSIWVQSVCVKFVLIGAVDTENIPHSYSSNC